MWLIQETHYLNVHSTCNYWSIQSNASFIHKVINNCCKMGGKKKSQPREGEYIYNDVLYGQEFERSKTKSKPHPIFHFQL